MPAYNVYTGVRDIPITSFRGCGGILIAVKNSINLKSFQIQSVSNNIVWVILEDEKSVFCDKILLGCVYYSPPRSSLFANENVFEICNDEIQSIVLSHSVGKVLLTCDMNARTGILPDMDYGIVIPGDDANDGFVDSFLPDEQRYNKDSVVNNRGHQMLDFCKSLGLRICNGRVGDDRGVGHFTCVNHNGGKSVVDYLLANHTIFHDITMFRVGHAPSPNSVHFPLEFSISINNGEIMKSNVVSDVMKRGISPRMVWKKNRARDFILDLNIPENIDKINGAIDSAKFGAVSDSYSDLCDIIRSCGSSMIRKSRANACVNKKQQNTWFDNDCEIMKEQSRACLNQARSFDGPDDENSDMFRYLDIRRDYKALTKLKAKEFHSHNRNLLYDALNDRDVKTFWSLIKGVVSSGPLLISHDEWFDFFSNLFSAAGDLLAVPDRVNIDIITDANFTIAQIDKIVNKAKNNRSCGEDGIPAEVWKNVPSLRNVVLDFFNACWDRNVYPDQWKSSIIVPIYKKKGSPSLPDCYRGIALLPSMGKMYSAGLCLKLVEWAERSDFFIKTQSGFRAGFSCTDNLFILDTIISKYASDEHLYAAFIDFRKAFDSVNRNKLWIKLLEYNVPSKLVNVLKNMYTNIVACVRSSPSSLTDNFPCHLGLRQGDSLSGTLFIMFVNDLEKFLIDNDCGGLVLDRLNLILMFLADDLSLFDRRVRGLQRKFNLLARYCSENDLHVNLDKTNVVVFRHNGTGIRPEEHWYFEGKNVEVVNTYTYLGLIVYYSGSWSLAIDALARKGTRCSMYVFSQLSRFGNLNPSVILKVMDTKIIPMMIYGCEVWGKSDFERVERVLSNLYRRLLYVPQNTSVAFVRGELGRYPICATIFPRMIRYWLNAIEAKDGSAMKCAYNTQYEMTLNGIECWGSFIKYILTRYGFEDVWRDQSVSDPDTFMIVFKLTCLEFEKRVWYHNVQNFGMLRAYAHFKIDLVYENYLDLFIPRKWMSYFIRLRGGLLPIRSNTGRWYENIAYDGRICTFCSSGEVENEYHLLLRCRAWSSFRLPLVQKFHEFQMSNFVSIMTSCNRELVWAVCKFIKDVLQFRDDIDSVIPFN